MNYYITNVLAIGIGGGYYFNNDSKFNAETRRAARVAVPLTEYQWQARAQLHVRADVRQVRRLQRLHLPLRRVHRRRRRRDLRKAHRGRRSRQPALQVGRPQGRLQRRHRASHLLQSLVCLRPRGSRLHLLRQAREHRGRGDSHSGADQKTWYGETKLTNNVQAQLGVSIFLPFSWEYRLPK